MEERSRVWRKVGLIVAMLLLVGAAPMAVGWFDEDEPVGPGYAWMFERGDGSPVRFDPCTPVRFEVNPRREIEDGDRMVAEALDSVADATGLDLVLDGETDEPPTFDVDERESGDPVVIGWSDPRETEDLEGDTTGVGGGINEEGWYVGGTVALDGPELAELVEDGGWDEARAVVMHEIAHVIGLSHVRDRDQLMHPQAQPGVTDWGPGDLAGLEILGSGPCRD